MNILTGTDFKTYEIKNNEKLEQLVELINRMIHSNTITKEMRPQEENKFNFTFKDYGLLRELWTLTTSYKKDMEAEILKDKEFNSIDIPDLGKTLALTYKNTFNVNEFINEYETQIQPIPKELLDKYTTISIKQNRPATIEDASDKKNINIIDELKAITPRTKSNFVSDLKVNATKPSASGILTFTKIKKNSV